MSQFHENIRTIFEDVERFLIVHIKPLSRNLSYEGRLQREKILSAIHDLKVAYPALENIGACSEFTEGGGGTDRSRSTLQSDTGFSSNSQGSSSGSENRPKLAQQQSPANGCPKVLDRNAASGKKGFNKSAFTSKKNLLAAIFLSRSTLSLHPKKPPFHHENHKDFMAPSSTDVQSDHEMSALANQVQENENNGLNCEVTSQALPVPPTSARTADEHCGSGSSTASSLTSIKDTFASNESACFDPGSDASACDQVLMAGYLEKRKKGADGLKGALLNRFQKKWCVLRPHLFEIYDRKGDKKPKTQLSLSQYEFYHPSPLVICQEARYRSFVLEGIGNLRCYHLLAESRRSVLEWKEVFLSAKQISPNSAETNGNYNEPSPLSPSLHHETPFENGKLNRKSPLPFHLQAVDNMEENSNTEPEQQSSHPENVSLASLEKCENAIDKVALKASNSFSTTVSDLSCSPNGRVNLEPDLIMTEYIERVGSRLNSAAVLSASKSCGKEMPELYSGDLENSHCPSSSSPPSQVKRGTSLKVTPKSFSEDEWRKVKTMLNTSLDSCNSHPLHAFKTPEYIEESGEYPNYSRITNPFKAFETTPERSFPQQPLSCTSVSNLLPCPQVNNGDSYLHQQSLHLLGPERIYLAVGNCQPDGPDELELYHSDPVYVISKRFDHLGWWIGISLHQGSLGFVPKCHLTPAYSSQNNSVKANC